MFRLKYFIRRLLTGRLRAENEDLEDNIDIFFGENERLNEVIVHREEEVAKWKAKYYEVRRRAALIFYKIKRTSWFKITKD